MSFEEFSQALGSMDPTELALGAGMVGAVLTSMAVVAVAWFFVSAIGFFKMFQKAGARSWMAFIPLLRDYVRFKIAWSPSVFWVFLVVTIAFQLTSTTENAYLAVVAMIIGIVLLVLQFKVCIRLAKSFGKTTGWGVLLFFFPFIVSLILGFGKAQYIGNTTTADAGGV